MRKNIETLVKEQTIKQCNRWHACWSIAEGGHIKLCHEPRSPSTEILKEDVTIAARANLEPCWQCALAVCIMQNNILLLLKSDRPEIHTLFPTLSLRASSTVPNRSEGGVYATPLVATHLFIGNSCLVNLCLVWTHAEDDGPPDWDFFRDGKRRLLRKPSSGTRHLQGAMSRESRKGLSGECLHLPRHHHHDQHPGNDFFNYTFDTL